MMLTDYIHAAMNQAKYEVLFCSLLCQLRNARIDHNADGELRKCYLRPFVGFKLNAKIRK